MKLTRSCGIFKVGFSPSKKIVFIYFNENPLKVKKNAFYFMLKALFVLEIFKFFVGTFWSPQIIFCIVLKKNIFQAIFY